MYLLYIIEGPGQEIFKASFSAGDFRSFKSTHPKLSAEGTVTEEASSLNSKDGSLAARIYTCPRGCTRVFQRFSALENNMSLKNASDQ